MSEDNRKDGSLKKTIIISVIAGIFGGIASGLLLSYSILPWTDTYFGKTSEVTITCNYSESESTHYYSISNSGKLSADKAYIIFMSNKVTNKSIVFPKDSQNIKLKNSGLGAVLEIKDFYYYDHVKIRINSSAELKNTNLPAIKAYIIDEKNKEANCEFYGINDSEILVSKTGFPGDECYSYKNFREYFFEKILKD